MFMQLGEELLSSPKWKGFITRTFFTKEGKKVRKNWGPMYMRYIKQPEGHHFPSGSQSLVLFSKRREDEVREL